jgi:hypothetical protein
VALAAALAGCDLEPGPSPIASRAMVTTEGAIVVLGKTSAFDTDPMDGTVVPPGDGWLLALSREGEEEWQLALGTPGLDALDALVELPTGSLLAVGAIADATATDAWIVSLDRGGVVAYERALVGPGAERFVDVAATIEGGFVALGVAATGTGTEGISVVRFDTEGATEWQRHLGLAGLVFSPVRILAREDGGFVVVSAVASVTDEDPDVAVVGLDPNGALEWAFRYEGDGDAGEVPTDVVRLADGGLRIAVDRESYAVDGSGLTATVSGNLAWIALDDNGLVLTAQELDQPGANERGARIVRRVDESFTLLATSDTPITGDSDLLVLDVDAEGIAQTPRTIGSPIDRERPVAGLELGDALTVVGATEVSGGEWLSFWELGEENAIESGCGVVTDASATLRPLPLVVTALELEETPLAFELAPTTVSSVILGGVSTTVCP